VQALPAKPEPRHVLWIRGTEAMSKPPVAKLTTRAATIALAAALVACGADATQPSTSGLAGHLPTTSLESPRCQVEGPNVRCSVRYAGGGGANDVTSLAAWSLSSAAFENQPTTAAAVDAPGFIVPRDGGNISIDAAYGGWHSRAYYRFALAPGRDVIALAPALTVIPREPDSRTIGDVMIEILNGPYAGQTRTTLPSGYSAFEFYPVGVPFTVRLSKTGYQTVTQSYSGIADVGGAPLYIFNIILPRTP